MEASTKDENKSAQAADQGSTGTAATDTGNGSEAKPTVVVDEGSTLSGGPLRELADAEPKEAPQGAEAVKAVTETSPDRLKRELPTQNAALDWLLSSEPTVADAETKTLQVNIGSSDEPNWVNWVIKAVPMQVMRNIRKRALNSREARRTGQVDEYRTNLEVVAIGTLEPDLEEAARKLSEQGVGHGDPVELLRGKFASKPGYIAQISGEIMGLSGFDDEDVREAEAVEAGKD